MLAHALLHTEPEPLELFDDFGDLERSTLPPPEAMSDHVARMMEEASRNEDLDDDGDRPTPLMEVHPRPGAHERHAAMHERAPAAQERRPAVQERTPAAQERRPMIQERAPAPHERRPAAHERAVQERRPVAQERATAVQERRPAAQEKAPAMSERRAPTPLPARMPAMPERRAPTPPPGRLPAMTERRAPTPPPGRLPTMTERRPPVQEPPIELDDLSDLPAVFGFALDDVAVDAPLSPPAVAPFSEAAISPPFDSADLRRIVVDEPSADRLAAIETRLSAGDFGRALVLAEAALDEHPGNAAVLKYAESCRQALYERYLERLGAADHVPRLAMQRSALTGLSLDHRAGFLLSCVDGGSTVEEIIDVSAMPRLDAVRLLYELLQEGIIEMAAQR